MLGYLNNWNIIKLSHKATFSEEIDEIHQVLLYGIIENMAALVKTDKYGSINTTYTTKMGYYVIKFMSKPYTLQEEDNYYGQISNSGELFVKAQPMNCMKENTK